MLAYRNVGRATALPTHADAQIFAAPDVVPSSFLHDLMIRTARPHNADISREAQRHRNFGNVAFLQGNLNEALQCYTKGIELCPHHHILRANRCVLYSLAVKFVPACLDAEAIIASVVVFQSVFEQTQHMLSLCHTNRMPVTQISNTLIDAIKLLNQALRTDSDLLTVMEIDPDIARLIFHAIPSVVDTTPSPPVCIQRDMSIRPALESVPSFCEQPLNITLPSPTKASHHLKLRSKKAMTAPTPQSRRSCSSVFSQ